MSTAKVAKPLPGDALYQRRAMVVLPLLVRHAAARRTVAYGELAADAGISNPRNLNYPLGCIGQTLRRLSTEWGERIPPIQCLVVNKSRGAPSEGVGEFLSEGRDFDSLSEREQRSVVSKAQRMVFAFQRWPAVLDALNLRTESGGYSAAEYKSAFERAPLTQRHRRLLEAHLAAPNQTVSATQLARMMGYKCYPPANRQYGGLGILICEYLGWDPRPNQAVFSLVTFSRRAGEWHWTMRPEVVEALRQLGWGESEEPLIPEEVPASEQYFEGAVRTIKVNAYERNSAARAKCLAHYGRVCAVCGLRPSDRYGAQAEAVIHVHHIRPLAEINARYKVDPIRDLCPVCPTCHAVIHTQRPALSVGAVRMMLSEAATALPPAPPDRPPPRARRSRV